MDRSDDDGPRAPDRHKNSGRSNSRDQKPTEVFSQSSIAYQSAISSLSLYSSTLAEVGRYFAGERFGIANDDCLRGKEIKQKPLNRIKGGVIGDKIEI